MMAKTCDGRVSVREDEAFLWAMKRAHTLSCFGERELRDFEARTAAGLSEATLADVCARIPEHLRLPVFAQALDILLADGDLSEAEADFVNGLIFALNINRDEAEPIVDVLAVKNRL
jgi:hypothetical protein